MTSPSPGPLEQGELLQELARGLVAAAPEGWRQLTYLARVVGALRSDMLAVQGADGQVRQVEVPEGVAEVVDALKRSGFQEGVGTWLSMIISVHHSHRFEVEYNSDTEPELPPDTSPLAYAQELERFPRDGEHTPDWMAARVEQARGLDPARMRTDFGRALVRECEREGLRAQYEQPTRLRVSTPDGETLVDADLEDTFDQAVIVPEDQRADLAARFAGFVARAAREGEQTAGAPSADPGDPVAAALVEAFAEAGVRAAFQGTDTLVVSLPDGGQASADVSAFRDALNGAAPERIAREAAEFARTSVAQLVDAGREDGGSTAGRLRARLYPASAFPEGLLDSLVAREVAPGLWQTVVVDSPDSLRPLSRQAHERSGRTDAEVFDEAVADSVAEPVEVSEHDVDGVRIVHIGGQHPYVAARVHALERHLGDLPHGALVAFPVPEVLLAHPLGKGHPITAMDRMRQIAERFTADGDKPISAQLYWWHPSSRGRDTPPDLRAVGTTADGLDSPPTGDEEFASVVDSLLG